MSKVTALWVVGLAVPALVALLIAYQHRRQMRQLELFRLDPSVGVKPPQSAVFSWLNRWTVWLGIASLFVLLWRLVVKDSPLTRIDAALIAMSAASIALGLSLIMVSHVLRVLEKIAYILVDLIATTAKPRT